MPIHLWPDEVGYLAAALLLATFFMRRMVPLRTVAIASSLAWLTYGLADDIYPIVTLHVILLPLNSLRLCQAMRDEGAKARNATGGAARFSSVRGAISAARAISAFLLRGLHVWRERAQLRRELSMMSLRDFGDLSIPPSLIFDERRRWPWQPASPQWAEVKRPRRTRSLP